MPKNLRSCLTFCGGVSVRVWAHKVTKANKTKKNPWHWDLVHQQAFDTVKATIACDVTLAYPDYSQGLPPSQVAKGPHQAVECELESQCSKFCFCTMETEYLGYILSRDGIKPQPKKVQAILALTLPQNVK